MRGYKKRVLILLESLGALPQTKNIFTGQGLFSSKHLSTRFLYTNLYSIERLT